MGGSLDGTVTMLVKTSTDHRTARQMWGLLLAVQDKCKDCNEARAFKVPTHGLKPGKRATFVIGDDDLTGRATIHRGRRDGDDQMLDTRAAALRGDAIVRAAV